MRKRMDCMKESYNYAWVERVRYYRGETASDTEYLMYDGTKLSLSSAKIQVEDYLKNTVKQFEPDYNFAVHSAYIYKMDDGEYVINRIFEGIPLDSKMYGPLGLSMLGGVTRLDNKILIEIRSATRFKTWFHSSEAKIYKIKEKTKLPDKFITFESALELLSKEITAKDNINLDSAEFCYVCSYEGNDEIKEMSAQIDEYHANPIWTFTSPLSKGDLADDLNKYHEPQRVYVVDAVTGEVYIYYDCIVAY